METKDLVIGGLVLGGIGVLYYFNKAQVDAMFAKVTTPAPTPLTTNNIGTAVATTPTPAPVVTPAPIGGNGDTPVTPFTPAPAVTPATVATTTPAVAYCPDGIAYDPNAQYLADPCLLHSDISSPVPVVVAPVSSGSFGTTPYINPIAVSPVVTSPVSSGSFGTTPYINPVPVTLPVVTPVTPVVATAPIADPVLASASCVYPNGLTEGELIKGSSASIWLLNGGNKWALTWEQYVAMGQPSFATIDDSIVSSVPTGAGTYWTGTVAAVPTATTDPVFVSAVVVPDVIMLKNNGGGGGGYITSSSGYFGVSNYF